MFDPALEWADPQHKSGEGGQFGREASWKAGGGMDTTDEAVHRLRGRMEKKKDANDDLTAGQIVIVFARWVLIATGLAITLWSPAEPDLSKIKISLLVLLGLAVANFYLHSHILMQHPVRKRLVYGASALDVGVITLLTWAYGGLAAPLFVFYYPALLGFALVFPRAMSVTFSGGLLAVYAAVCLMTVSTEASWQVFAARIISMAAMAVIGGVYQRVERERRTTEATAR
jgi:hypothetical protein